MKRFIAFLMIFVLCFVTTSNITPIKVYATNSYDADNNMLGFLVEFIAQHNKVAETVEMVKQYQKTGLSMETSLEMSKNNLKNCVIDAEGALNAVKNTFNSLTDIKKFKLIDFYNQVKNEVNFNIGFDMFNNLSLDLFSKDVVNNFIYQPPADNSGVTIITKQQFVNKFTPELGATGVSNFYNLFGQSNPINSFTKYTYALASNFLNAETGVWREKSYCYLMSSDFNNILIRCNRYDYLSIQGECKVGDIFPVANCHFFIGARSPSGLTNIADTAYSLITYIYGKYSYFGPAKSRHIHELYQLLTDYQCVIKEERYYISDVYFSPPQEIVNVTNYNNNVSTPYTKNTVVNNYFPEDPTWLATLKDIVNGIPVVVKEIVIHEPEPPTTEEPTTEQPTTEEPTTEQPTGENTTISAIDYINPLSDKFFLKVAFVPSSDFMYEEFQKMQDIIDTRIPVIGQVVDIFGDIKDVYNNTAIANKAPVIEIDLPPKYGGKKVSIIDFQFYTQYKPIIHSFITMIAVYFFIRKLLKRLPKVIL